MSDPLERWRALGDALDARLGFYDQSAPHIQPKLLFDLVQRADDGALTLLAQLIEQRGLTPAQVGGLIWGGMSQSALFEPLWLMLWRDLGAISESPVQVMLLSVATTRTRDALAAMIPDARGQALDHLERFAAQLDSRALPQPQPSPLDPLAQLAPLWSWDEQWAVMRLVEQEALGAGLRGVQRLVRRAREPRAQSMIRWLIEHLGRASATWQEALELCWATSPQHSPELMWTRQHQLWGQGAPLRLLRAELARALAPGAATSRACALLALPWSATALAAHAASEPLKAQEYAWLVAAGLPDGRVSRELEQLLEAAHAQMSALVLARSLSSVQSASSWPRASWLALTRRDEPQVQAALCGLIARLKLHEGKPWLERLVIESPDLHVVERAIAALGVVGDTRSAGIIHTRAQRSPALAPAALNAQHVLGGQLRAQPSGQLTLAAASETGGELELMGGQVGALTMDGEQGERAVARRDPWERLVSGPRAVSALTAHTHLGWVTPSRPRAWLLFFCLWPLAASALLLALKPTLSWMDWEVGLRVYLLVGALLGLAALLRIAGSSLSAAQLVLTRGAPVMGQVVEDRERGLAAQLTDEQGQRLTVAIAPHQREGLEPGRYPMLFLRHGEAARVEVVRALAAGPQGQLVGAPGARWRARAALLWLLSSWCLFVWGLYTSLS